MARLFLSAAHKSSGKTTVSAGLCAALARRGLDVRPFKRGPDYIDPLWLGRAAGTTCYNLDFNTQAADEITGLVARRGGGDITLVEGNKGLYDGIDPDGADSNAALARLLGTPVILVVDTVGMTRGIAPLLLGYRQFDPDLPIAGVILNRVGGERHESKLRTAVEGYTDLPVLGAVQRDSRLVIDERHMGLVPANEANAANTHLDRLADAVDAGVDVDAVLDAARAAPAPAPAAEAPPATPNGPRVRVGIARDAAFGFYYPDDLEALEAAGAEIVPFDTLHADRLPEAVDALFLGGGFPETHMRSLAANRPLLNALSSAVTGGLPVYAECGGLMLLGRSLTRGPLTLEMAGALPVDTAMDSTPQGRGTVRLRATGDAPWDPGADGAFPAHEFHYSRIVRLDGPLPFAYSVERGHGMDGHNDGLVRNNTVAAYAHLRNVRATPWAARFVAFVRRCRGA